MFDLDEISIQEEEFNLSESKKFERLAAANILERIRSR